MSGFLSFVQPRMLPFELRKRYLLIKKKHQSVKAINLPIYQSTNLSIEQSICLFACLHHHLNGKHKYHTSSNYVGHTKQASITVAWVYQSTRLFKVPIIPDDTQLQIGNFLSNDVVFAPVSR